MKYQDKIESMQLDDLREECLRLQDIISQLVAINFHHMLTLAKHINVHGFVELEV